MPRRPLLLGLLLLSITACGRKADLVITGGMVWTGLSSGEAQPGAVAIAAGRILAVGDSAEIARYVGSRTDVIQANGGLVLPGFADGHAHVSSGGFQLASLDLHTVASPQEFIRRLAEYARGLKPGQWITGGDWDHELWPGAPLPRRDWIDSVTPHNPVFIDRLDGHMALANTAALRAAGVTKDTPEPAGGVIVRDPGTGEPTGILKDNAEDLVEAVIPDPSPEQRDSALVRAFAHAASLGVTAIAHMSASWGDLASYRRLRDAGRLTLRVALYLPLTDWREVADSVNRSGRGDLWLRIGGVKGYVDGSLGSTTALLFAPYTDAPHTAGLIRSPEESLRTWVGAADSAGFQVALHAIGDRANAIALGIYDSVARAHGPRDRRLRIEHAQHLRREEVLRFGELRVVASMQPPHLIDDGEWAGKRLGPARVGTSYVFRTLLDTKAPLAFGSDWPVAPLDPLTGVFAAVTRRTRDGRNPAGWIPGQKITLAEALRAYTAGNAWAMFAEEWGTLAPGYLADLVVLDRNLFTIPPDSLDRARVRYTIVGGQVVFRR